MIEPAPEPRVRLSAAIQQAMDSGRYDRPDDSYMSMAAQVTAARHEREMAMQIIAHLVRELGGRVEVPDVVLADGTPWRMAVMRDEAHNVVVLQTFN